MMNPAAPPRDLDLDGGAAIKPSSSIDDRERRL